MKLYVITAGIKKHKSMIKKKKQKHDKVVLLIKSKLNSVEVLISNALVDSNISYDEFFLTKNVLKKFCWKKKSKTPITNKSWKCI